MVVGAVVGPHVRLVASRVQSNKVTITPTIHLSMTRRSVRIVAAQVSQGLVVDAAMLLERRKPPLTLQGVGRLHSSEQSILYSRAKENKDEHRGREVFV
jgi:hypothetical protein